MIHECRRCLGPLDESGDCHACEDCPRCKGEGSVRGLDMVEMRPADDYVECRTCDGFGWIGANGNPARRV